MLWHAIEPFMSHLRMKSQASKGKWVEAVCLALNTPGLVQSLPRAPSQQSYVPVRSSFAIMPFTSRIPALTQQSRVHLPISVPPSSLSVSFQMPLMTEPSNLGDCPFERSLQFMFGDANMLPPPIMFPRSSISCNTQKRKRDGTVTVKTEPGFLYSQSQFRDNEDRPCTLQESTMMNELRQMGFSDEREMLAGIRHVSSQVLHQRVDDAMMWIVQQREEAAEAKKVDAVRARSESLRYEQVELKRRNKKARMDAATMYEWATEREFFQGSVILQFASAVLEPLRKSHEKVLVDFLELEKNARKWFGPNVPYCYFLKRAQEWREMGTINLADDILKETAIVQTAMFSLSEQQGGVPKVFMLATKEFKDKGLPTGPNGSIEDDEIAVIEDWNIPEAAQPKVDMQQEVIEIDFK